MPQVVIQGPPVDDLDRKRELVRGLTEAAAKYYDFPKTRISVLIKENMPENVGVGGELIIDRDRKKREQE